MIAGTSRVQQIDWYTASGLPGTQSVNHYRDWDGHGTHVAGTVAGKTHGWAKGSRIYSQKLNGLEFDGNTGISIIDAFDTIRLWHNAKTIDPATGFKRPTVVNMSWGYSTTRSGAPDSGTYRGVDWNYDIDYTTRSGLWAGVGYTQDFINGGTQQRVPVRVPSVDAEIEDMISQGIHVCIAAGNNLYKAELLGGVDYNNTVTFGVTTTNYHRGSSPYSDNAFMVGNLDTATFNDGGIFRDKTAFSSTRGPGVNIWAPGTSIVSACSTTNQFGSSPIPSPEDSNFKILSISGTSMASPQVAGVVAQHLQVRPDLTPAQMQDRINDDTLEVIYTTDSTTDYSTNESILGAANRHLYSRYGVANPVTMPLSALTFTGLRLKLD
jgi:subtilisin family serine protease